MAAHERPRTPTTADQVTYEGDFVPQQDTTPRSPARRRAARGRAPALGVAATRVLALWRGLGRRHAGATDQEVDDTMPGDELVAYPDVRAARGITVDAPPDEVWPWIAQIGQGRGGLYSYDGLENLLGMDIHSPDRVLPEHQDVRAGDVVRLAAQSP